MTEAEWFAADEREVHRFVAALSPRRQRLLAVAACRVLGKRIDFPAAHVALGVVEMFADTGKTKVALRRARQSIVATRNELYNPPSGRSRMIDGGVDLALFVIQVAASENAVIGSVTEALKALVIAEGISEDTARRWMCAPVSDILSGPTNPVALDPAWLTSTAVAQRVMYESRTSPRCPFCGRSRTRLRQRRHPHHNRTQAGPCATAGSWTGWARSGGGDHTLDGAG